MSDLQSAALPRWQISVGRQVLSKLKVLQADYKVGCTIPITVLNFSNRVGPCKS